MVSPNFLLPGISVGSRKYWVWAPGLADTAHGIVGNSEASTPNLSRPLQLLTDFLAWAYT